jgi:hypothetical protein
MLSQRHAQVVGQRRVKPTTVHCAPNELSWSLLDCTLRAAPRKALTRSAAMAHRHSASLGRPPLNP